MKNTPASIPRVGNMTGSARVQTNAGGRTMPGGVTPDTALESSGGATTKIYALRENHFVRYVGKTHCSLSVRLSGHLDSARKGEKTHKGCWIRSLLNKGLIPEITLIGEYDGNGDKEEIAWIKYFRDRGVKLTNATDGGQGGGGWHHTQESRQKLSRALTGKKYGPQTAEHREKNRAWHKGKAPCALAIKKARIANTGCKRAPEVGIKISKKLTGRAQTPEHVANAKAGRNAAGVNDVYRTPAFREKMRQIVTESWKKRKQVIT